MTDARAQPIAVRGAFALARHPRRRQCLIDEDEPFEIEVALADDPVSLSFSARGDVIRAPRLGMCVEAHRSFLRFVNFRFVGPDMSQLAHGG